MSNNFNNYLGLIFNSNSKNCQLKDQKLKERGKSTSPLHIMPDIITQLKPFPLNNISQPLNLHKLSFTPTNKSRDILQSDLLLPPKSIEYLNKKTLILDLDETLVHSTTTYVEKSDITLEVDFEGMLYNIYVLIRPGAKNFIKKVSKLYETIIFTASLSKYASPLLDKLDPDKNIKYRLYREHCTFLNGIYIKELKRLNRDLKDVLIVDNSPLAYSFDVENGLPIKSWYEDKSDDELEIIFPVLEFLSKVNDVRDYIELFVENNEIKYEQAFQIITALNNYNNKIEDKKNADKNNIEENNKDNNNNKESKKDNKDNKENNKYIKNKNILSLHDFLNPFNSKIIGNIFKKSISKSNLKLEEIKINTNKKNETDKTDNNTNNNTKNNKNLSNENNKTKKTSYRNRKNVFRMNKNLAHMSLKNMQSNDINKKINSIFPLSLSLTNSTKMINFKKRGNNMSNLKLVSIKDTNDNNKSKNDLKNNHIYTNLIDKLKANKDIYNNSSTNNNSIYQNNNNNKGNMIITRNSKSFKLTKHKNLLIRTPNINQQGYFPINKNNPINYSSKTSRSKSTGNFNQFNNKGIKHPKTPKANQRLINLEVFDRKNSFKFNCIKNINSDKPNPSAKRKFTPSFSQKKYKIKIKKLGFKIK